MASEYAKKVADTIIKQLEQGTAPWIKPWNAGDRFLPHNPTSGKAYKGMNALYLLAVSQERGYDDNRWVTYNQAQAAGAQVNKSGKGQGVALQFWKWEGLTPALDEKGNKIREDGKVKMVVEKYERPKLFSFVVFNAAHIDNMPEKTLVPPLSEWERNQKAEAILRNSGATLEHKAGNSAHYSPSQDKIVLPIREQFPTPDNYYATALHELGHWTGHETRLNRDLKHPFGSEAYAKEELRAEIASMMLGEELGIGHDPGQHVSYINSWIKALKEDPNEIFRAAADAERITKYVSGLEKVQEQERQQDNSKSLSHSIPLWRVLQDSDVLEETASANEAIELFRSQTGTRIEDISTGERVAHTEWVRDGAAVEWVTHGKIEAAAAIESRGLIFPVSRPDLSDSDRNLAEAIMLATNHPEQDSFQKNLLDRGIDSAAVEAFGQSVGGLRSSKIPQSWSGEARTQGMIVTGDYDSGELSGREALEGEQPTEWEIQLSDRDGNWHWFANADSAEQGATLANRLSEIGVAAGLKKSAEQQSKSEGVDMGVEPESPEKKTDKRNDKPVYLKIPYEEKEEAKAIALKNGVSIEWDGENKLWSLPAGADVSPFLKWQIETADNISVMREVDPRQEFAEVLKDYGLELDALPDMDGELRRVRVEGDKPDQKSGAYVGYLDGHPAGYVQNFKTGQSQNWKATGTTQSLSNTDKARLAAEAAQRKTERARERDERFGSVLQVIAQRVATSKHALNDHPYLQAKGVEAGEDVYLNEGEAIEFSFTGDKKPPQKWSEKGDLMIAYRDIEGNLMGAQSIDRDGRKSLPRGGRVQGGFHMIGEPAAGKTILVAEGYATGKSLQEISGQPVAVAFHAGNLEAVAQALKAKYPDKPIYIAGDNDHRKEKEIGPDGKPKANVGKEKALDAARATGTHALLPMFSPDDRGSDWNDLVQLKGKEHAREQLRKAVIQAKSKEQLTEQNLKKDAAITQDKSRVRVDEDRTKTKVKSR